MPTLSKVEVGWAGSPVVGGGVSVFYMTPPVLASELADLMAFFDGLKTFVPTGITWTIPSSGDNVDDATGEVSGSWSAAGGGGSVEAIGGPAFVNGVGARVTWRTNTVLRGRRVVGSTFIVPLLQSAYEGSGNIIPTTVAGLQAAGDALVASLAGSLRILSRPSTPGGGDGTQSAIFAAVAPDRVSWLRSRRT